MSTSMKLNNKKILLLIIIIAIVCIVVSILSYYPLTADQFQLVCKILTWENLIYFLTFIGLGSLIGWSFIFSILKQPSSLKQKLADRYIIFLVGILNHSMLSDKFIIFTLALGAFIGRKFVWIWSISYPKSLLVIIFCPFLSFGISLLLLFGFYMVSVHCYPHVFGKFFINFLEKNASKEVLRIIG